MLLAYSKLHNKNEIILDETCRGTTFDQILITKHNKIGLNQIIAMPSLHNDKVSYYCLQFARS